MIWPQKTVHVRVPATSANLGPGFDTMGLALGLHDRVEAGVTGAGLSIDVAGEGTGTAGAGEEHLVVRAMRAAFARLGSQPPGLALRCANTIPHGRGLGSSAAAIVSGLLAARALVPGGTDILTGEEVFRLAVDLEGHPDNVAACLAGGLTVAWTPRLAGEGTRRPAQGARGDHGGPQDRGRAAAGAGGVRGGAGAPDALRAAGGVRAAGEARTGTAAGRVPGAGMREARLARVAVNSGLKAVVCVPPVPLTTETARQVLPEVVPHADAAANAARCALLVLALTSEPSLIYEATEDFLHQAYRAGVMPETADLLGRLRRRGIAAVVSGAGPSVLVLTFAGEGREPEVVDSIAAEAGIAWRVIPLDVDRQGALVRPGRAGAQPSASTRQDSSWTQQAQGLDAGFAGGSPQGRPALSETPTTPGGMPWPHVVLNWASHRVPRGARCPLVVSRDVGYVVGCG